MVVALRASVSLHVGQRSDSLLYLIISGGWDSFQEKLHRIGRFLPRHAEREVEGFLACGDAAEGFAWIQCRRCAAHELVTFSCKGRGFCPTCGGRRMNSFAARWVDGVFPRVPVRQFVLTVPWARRWLLARRPDLARGCLSIGLREIQRWMRERTGCRQGRGGSVTVIQRFGSALNLNVHFHALVIDGVYDVDSRTGRLRFHRAKGIRTEDVERLILRISERCERWLSRQGEGDSSEDQDSALPFLHGASVMGKAALGKRGGRRVRRVQTFAGRDHALPSKCASCMGYSLHAAVMIPRRDRAGLERLCRYIARPPLAQERLEEVSEGTYKLTLKTPWSDGTGSLLLDRMEVIGRLVSLIPPPRANQVLYHGIFAPRSKYRRQILPMYKQKKVLNPETLRLTNKEQGEKSRWMLWAELMKRVFQEDVSCCVRCGGRMELRAVVIRPPATLKVLAGLVRSERGRDPPGEVTGWGPV